MNAREAAESGLAWVLHATDLDDPCTEPGLHSGLGGVALALAEARRLRPWSEPEAQLAAAIVDRIRADVATTSDANHFDGLAGHLLVLDQLGEPGADEVVRRLGELLTDDGWPQAWVEPHDARLPDATLGAAGPLLAAVWAHRHDVPGAADLVARTADVLVAEAEHDDLGPWWPFVPRRHRPEGGEMPNWSHGAAGVAAALAVAGHELGRVEWTDLATRAAARLVALADLADGGLHVPHVVPARPAEPDSPPRPMGWCHGPAGTQLLFAALDHAGFGRVAGESPSHWRERCWTTIRASGIPERRYPGFWDNDASCCGTAGILDLALDAGHDDLADRLAQALLDHALEPDDGAPGLVWRSIEHRAEEPLLPATVGRMQGTSGIVAVLFRVARRADGDRTPAPRPDTWWGVVDARG